MRFSGALENRDVINQIVAQFVFCATPVSKIVLESPIQSLLALSDVSSPHHQGISTAFRGASFSHHLDLCNPLTPG